ncbi:MAG: Plug domain-containing protein [Deltaproteobacteria bacterium]|nr:Plug domain-containing protein [Deltaproteobacteria bacterium]
MFRSLRGERPAIGGVAHVLLALVLVAQVAHAESSESAKEDPNDHPDEFHEESVEKRKPRDRLYSYGIDEIVVTASPLPKKASELPGAVSILQGTELLQKQQPTIGETVRYIPGVSASYYGPGASRPILRGLGGSRVQMLLDQLEVFDAWAASNDHAVTVDTLGIEKIEILRGPATLRFGPNAVGGVVSTIENRVPRKLVDAPVTGTVELRGSSVDGGVGGAAVLNGSVDKFAWRLKGYGFTAGTPRSPALPSPRRCARPRRTTRRKIRRRMRSGSSRTARSSTRASARAARGSTTTSTSASPWRTSRRTTAWCSTSSRATATPRRVRRSLRSRSTSIPSRSTSLAGSLPRSRASVRSTLASA